MAAGGREDIINDDVADRLNRRVGLRVNFGSNGQVINSNVLGSNHDREREDGEHSDEESGEDRVENVGGVKRTRVSDEEHVSSNNMVSMSYFKKEIAKLKRENFNAHKSAEVGKHKSPQIKRSLDVLMTLQYNMNVLSEAFDRSYAGLKGDAPLDVEDLNIVKENIVEIKKDIENEIMANKIASKSKYKWRTVKFMNHDSLFTGDDAEAMTKRFRFAEKDAGRGGFNNRGRFNNAGTGRGSFNNGAGSSGRGGGFSGGASGFSGVSLNRGGNSGGRRFINNRVDEGCFECGLEGHIKKYCPKLAKNNS